jgi:predicted cupin superfamily sugar epimerase/quercetin dioxygenase-like cupin family protein
MQRVPQEGPWFSLTYASDDSLDGASLAPRYAGRTHLAGTAIVLIETAADFSAMHRLQTDEVWHFYGGSPIEMLLLYPDGHGRRLTLGPDVMAGELPQFAVPHGVWQGSRPRGTTTRTYSFAGDQLSPGFDYADFEMGYRDTLAREYPAFAQDIARLTRPEYAVRPVPVASNPPAQATPASVFAAAEVPPQRVAAGVELRELVGRVAPLARTDLLSIAQFTLAPGHGSGTSFNHRSQEVFMVLSGSGRVHLDARVVPVGPGSTVFIPAQQRHSIAADAGSSLIFFAVSAPAFAPDDYVAVPP